MSDKNRQNKENNGKLWDLNPTLLIIRQNTSELNTLFKGIDRQTL